MGRTLKVDHTRYKKKDDEAETGMDLTKDAKAIVDGKGEEAERRRSESDTEEERPMLKEEIELAKLIQNHDEDDPMKQFLIEEKKEEVTLALARVSDGKKSRKSGHKHRHHHSSKREKEGAGRSERHSHRRRGDIGIYDADRKDPTARRVDKPERRRSRSREDIIQEDGGNKHRRRDFSPGERRHRSRRDS